MDRGYERKRGSSGERGFVGITLKRAEDEKDVVI